MRPKGLGEEGAMDHAIITIATKRGQGRGNNLRKGQGKNKKSSETELKGEKSPAANRLVNEELVRVDY